MEEVLENIKSLLKKVESGFNSLVDKINGILSHVPWGLGWLADKFKSLWNKAVDKMEDFWDTIKPIIELPGVPWTINSRKDSWVEVGSKSSGETITATEGQLQTDDADKWSGRSKDAYVKGLADQKAAIKGIKSTFVDKIVPALDAVSSAIYLFWVSIVAAIGILIVAIAAATGEAVSIFGLPALPPTVWGGIAACLAAVGIGTTNLRNVCSTQATVFSTLKSESTDYGPDNWPKCAI
ncbi:MAG TPA: hypothetical protein VGJ41_11625 [Nocardioides sp.]|jgi:hypothetical protein